MDLPPDLTKQLAGPAGAATALFFLKMPWRSYIGAGLSGWGAAQYVGPQVFDVFPRFGYETSIYLVGLFSVIVVKKVFDTWEQFEAGALLREWVRKLLRLDKEPPK